MMLHTPCLYFAAQKTILGSTLDNKVKACVTKGPGGRKKIAGFEETGLATPILTEKEVQARVKIYRDVGKVSEMPGFEPFQGHNFIGITT
jgi:hypothetical protein